MTAEDIAAIQIALDELGKQHERCSSACTTRLIVDNAEAALRRIEAELQPQAKVGR